MCKDRLIATCLDTLTKPSQSTNTPNQSLPNMIPTKRHQSNMAQELRGWRLKPHNHSPQKNSNTFKTLSVPYYIIHEWLIQHFLPHSAQSQHNKPTAHGQWQMNVINSWITLPLTQIQAFETTLATWYLQSTQTPPTFPNLVVKAEQQDISTYQIVMTKTSTMAPYSTVNHWHPRPNLLHSTTAASLPLHFEPHSRNLATSN
jgi:hypothetical protein